ncbi:hypothetical protein ANO14919_030390 [Xylariales sp. No.14919]|nr:hypothetical protein ANO14919_030390 [Xylariales sp. No.14919]
MAFRNWSSYDWVSALSLVGCFFVRRWPSRYSLDGQGLAATRVVAIPRVAAGDIDFITKDIGAEDEA